MRSGKIVGGVALVSAAYAFITVPMTIVNGGVTSFSLILGTVTGVEMAFFVNGITLLFFILCGLFLGRSYMLGSLLSCICYMGFFSLFRALSLQTGFAWRGWLPLAVLVAAVIVGIGYGFCISAESTILGFDTVALILHKYWPRLSVAGTMAVINCIVVLAGFIVLSWREVAAGIVFSLVQARVLALMLRLLGSEAA